MNNDKSKTREKIKEMRQEANMSQRQFASHFGIPTRTLQKWEGEQATPPQYIPEMMEKILINEKLIEEKKGENKANGVTNS